MGVYYINADPLRVIKIASKKVFHVEMKMLKDESGILNYNGIGYNQGRIWTFGRLETT